jgi:biotin synthase
MPASMVRIAAGRHLMSTSDQALCFLAGANSFFTSESGKMLTEAVPCAEHEGDLGLLRQLGLRARVPFGEPSSALR